MSCVAKYSQFWRLNKLRQKLTAASVATFQSFETTAINSPFGRESWATGEVFVVFRRKSLKHCRFGRARVAKNSVSRN